MANYAVNDWNSGFLDSPNAVMAALETQYEAVDNTKTVRYVEVKSVGNKWIAFMIYDA